MASKWIDPSVSMPPQSDMDVLVVLAGKHIRIAYYYDDGRGPQWSHQERPWGGEYNGFVTAWAKLPTLKT